MLVIRVLRSVSWSRLHSRMLSLQCHHNLVSVSGKTPDGVRPWWSMPDATSTWTRATVFPPSNLSFYTHLTRLYYSKKKQCGRTAFEIAKSKETWLPGRQWLMLLDGFLSLKLQQMPHPYYHSLQQIHLPICSQMITGLVQPITLNHKPRLPLDEFPIC